MFSPLSDDSLTDFEVKQWTGNVRLSHFLPCLIRVVVTLFGMAPDYRAS